MLQKRKTVLLRSFVFNQEKPPFFKFGPPFGSPPGSRKHKHQWVFLMTLHMPRKRQKQIWSPFGPPHGLLVLTGKHRRGGAKFPVPIRSLLKLNRNRKFGPPSCAQTFEIKGCPIFLSPRKLTLILFNMISKLIGCHGMLARSSQICQSELHF